MPGIMRRLAQRLNARSAVAAEQQKLSATLRENEERYRIVAETASDAILTIDEKSRILYVNHAAEKIFGYDVEEMSGQELTMLMPEYLRHLHRAGLKKYVETGTKHISWQAVELPGLHKSGQEIALELSFGEFTEDGKRYFTGVARDITTRRRSEQRQAAQYSVTRALAESDTIPAASRSVLQAVCEHLGWGVGVVWSLDREAGVMRCVEIWHAPEVEAGEFESLSRQRTFSRGTGLPGRVWMDAAPVWVTELADDENFPRRAVAIKEHLHTAFGFPVMLGGVVLGVIEFFSNEVRPPEDELLKMLSAVGSQFGQFINRKQAEAALKTSEESYRSLADAMPQIVWTARADGYLDYYNRRWFEYTGMTLEQTVGWGWQPVLHPEDVEKALRLWSRAVVTGERYQIEYRFKRASDAQYRWHLGRAEPLRDADGRIVKWFGTSTDIDDQKRAEEGALAANHAKDNFLATLSHELRTPLTPIIGWMHMLRSAMIPISDYERSLAIIDKNSHALMRLINDLLDMSAIMSGKMRIESEEVLLYAALKEAVETVQAEADRRRIKIVISGCDQRDVIVVGDRMRLAQIFWNLLSNAVKFSRNDGEVRIRCEEDERELAIAFEDDGQGITEEFLPHVFEHFRQADESKTREHGGLGIGLALVRSFVKAHDGRVVAESEGPRRGSRFTVYLPLVHEAAAAHASFLPVKTAQARFVEAAFHKEAALPEEAALSEETAFHEEAALTKETPLTKEAALAKEEGPHLLLVEDAEDTLTLLQSALGLRGYHTTPCESAAEALRVAATTEFDLIISDIGLPQMDGYTLLKRLRELPHLRSVPAIALTGYAGRSDADAALAAGYDAHLAKPVDPPELIAAIEQLLLLRPKAGMK